MHNTNLSQLVSRLPCIYIEVYTTPPLPHYKPMCVRLGYQGIHCDYNTLYNMIMVNIIML